MEKKITVFSFNHSFILSNRSPCHPFMVSAIYASTSSFCFSVFLSSLLLSTEIFALSFLLSFLTLISQFISSSFHSLPWSQLFSFISCSVHSFAKELLIFPFTRSVAHSLFPSNNISPLHLSHCSIRLMYAYLHWLCMRS